MEPSLSLVFFAVALLTVPIASQGQEQCALPTSEDVKMVGEAVYGRDIPEGGPLPTLNVAQMHFTCLARVALNMYAWASVVIKFTASDDPGVVQVEQYELRCAGGLWGVHTTNIFDANLPSAPFDVETQEQCYRCEQVAASTPNYDAVSNCRRCASECENNGGGFCIGSGADDCCPFFNSSTGSCIDSCTEIDPNFGPNEDFVCVCSITCPPGHDRDLSDCSCVFVDGCEAAGQPCQNGGTCMSDLTTMPYYSCTCLPGYTNPNCSQEMPLKITFERDSPIVSGNDMTAFIHTNKPVADMECRMSGTEEVKNCTSGYVEFNDLPDRNKYTLEVVAETEQGETASIRREFSIERLGFCSAHLINEGVSIQGTKVTVEFSPSGGTQRTACILNPPKTYENDFYTCTNPVIMYLPSGPHKLKIVPKGCGSKRTPLIVTFEV